MYYYVRAISNSNKSSRFFRVCVCVKRNNNLFILKPTTKLINLIQEQRQAQISTLRH